MRHSFQFSLAFSKWILSVFSIFVNFMYSLSFFLWCDLEVQGGAGHTVRGSPLGLPTSGGGRAEETFTGVQGKGAYIEVSGKGEPKGTWEKSHDGL